MKKYAIELVCLILLIAIGGSVYYRCTHKAAANPLAVEAAAPTDWLLIFQIGAGVLVALIGAMPSLYRTYKSGGLKAAIEEVEEDAEIVVKRVSPILTPKQLDDVRGLLDQGHNLVDAYDAVKNKEEAKP